MRGVPGAAHPEVARDEIECDSCSEMIIGRSKRMMCPLEECTFHICSKCKQMAIKPLGAGSSAAVVSAATDGAKRDRASSDGSGNRFTPLPKTRRAEAGDAEESEKEQDQLMTQAILPMAWRLEQEAREERLLERMKSMMTDVMGLPIRKINADMDEMKQTLNATQAQSQKASEMASAATEAVRALKSEMVNKMRPGPTVAQSSGADRTATGSKDDKRKREMIVTGFAWNTQKTDVEQIINEIFTGLKQNVQDVFATKPRTSYGIVRFHSLEEKKSFKKNLSEKKWEQSYQGRPLYINDNDDKQDNDKNRAIGKVKRALMEVNKERKDVVALRRAGEVWIGDERVAKWKDGTLRVRGEAETLKKRIDELIAEKRAEASKDGLSD